MEALIKNVKDIQLEDFKTDFTAIYSNNKKPSREDTNKLLEEIIKLDKHLFLKYILLWSIALDKRFLTIKCIDYKNSNILKVLLESGYVDCLTAAYRYCIDNDNIKNLDWVLSNVNFSGNDRINFFRINNIMLYAYNGINIPLANYLMLKYKQYIKESVGHRLTKTNYMDYVPIGYTMDCYLTAWSEDDYDVILEMNMERLYKDSISEDDKKYLNDMIDYVIEISGYDSNKIFEIACTSSLPYVKTLLLNDIMLDVGNGMFWAAYAGKIDILEYLLDMLPKILRYKVEDGPAFMLKMSLNGAVQGRNMSMVKDIINKLQDMGVAINVEEAIDFAYELDYYDIANYLTKYIY
ncbi:Ankyrin-repeat protein [Orpheovirus IHUMI-LCC2]|uniref:Ankyrin-repeat protein n=1 Tax=Orpheovirus IHUMI-LCC2 TaxID=2023057 RepID=A0A2I2L3T3_9VIRU|nr:Ankyrin-repeat protein [Orpheovirus IHUMI-LCC2]SNW62215.1 Ankyrin-repeat protein [Orpheovirus IHUMI-LCC2]